MAEAKTWRVVLSNEELDVEAEQAEEVKETGSLKLYNNRSVAGSGFPSKEVVAAFAKGDWKRYYLSGTVTRVDRGGPSIA